MTIKSTQKVIKVGSSLAVTLPARSARSAGIDVGKEVDIIVKPHEAESYGKKTAKVEAEYLAFKKQYGSTLKNLADR